MTSPTSSPANATGSAPASKAQAAHRESIGDLVGNGSIEFSYGDPGEIQEAAGILPYGFRVYVPSPPGRSLKTNLAILRVLHEAGIDAIPHIAARGIESRPALLNFLRSAVNDYGVHCVMLVGGDQSAPHGPYSCSHELLSGKFLPDSGIREIAIAGYPEGHWNIPAATLQSNLEIKVTEATAQGLGVEIVTQFSFSLARVTEYCVYLDHAFPEVPVYVGMAGPASNQRLRTFARHCGVSPSLLGSGFRGVKVSNRVVHTDPSNQLEAVAHHCLSRHGCNVIGVHIYSFGGFVQSARWMQSILRHA